MIINYRNGKESVEHNLVDERLVKLRADGLLYYQGSPLVADYGMKIISSIEFKSGYIWYNEEIVYGGLI